MNLDVVSYSFDGENFTDNVPVMQLKDELLRARYEGDLYVKHSFVADEAIEKLTGAVQTSNLLNAGSAGPDVDTTEAALASIINPKEGK